MTIKVWTLAISPRASLSPPAAHGIQMKGCSSASPHSQSAGQSEDLPQRGPRGPGSQQPWEATQVLSLPPRGSVGSGSALGEGGLKGPASLRASVLSPPLPSPCQVPQSKGSEEPAFVSEAECFPGGFRAFQESASAHFCLAPYPLWSCGAPGELLFPPQLPLVPPTALPRPALSPELPAFH